MYDYRRLKVWQKAHELVLDVLKAMPRTPRRFSSLIGQITRAAESVAANIVEGRAADSDAEFARFLKMSIKSATELEYHLHLGSDLGMITTDLFERFRLRIVEVRAMLASLVRKLQDDDRSGPGRVHP